MIVPDGIKSNERATRRVRQRDTSQAVLVFSVACRRTYTLQPKARGYAGDDGDFAALILDGERETGVDALSVHQ